MSSLSVKDALSAVELPESETARLDGEVILAHVLGKDRTYLYTWPDALLTSEQEARFTELMRQRRRGIPVAYLTGFREFWSLNLKVNDSTLIPRPDTEILVEQVLELPLSGQVSLVDLGTGTGAIALAIGSERSAWNISGVDQSAEAVALAKQNAKLNQLEQVQFLQSDWFSSLEGKNFDVIVSNPPYIDPDDPHLNEGDVRFEPSSALISDNSGLYDIALIAEQSRSHLKVKGWLLLEHGYDQGEAVRTILQKNHYSDISTIQDLSGNDRVTKALWKGVVERSCQR